jgi:hypothetical protein
VDVARAFAAHAGEEAHLDRGSRGVRDWLDERTAMEVEDAAAETNEIAQRVQTEREINRAIADGMTRTPMGAATVAMGVDADEVRRVENNVAGEEG